MIDVKWKHCAKKCQSRQSYSIGTLEKSSAQTTSLSGTHLLSQFSPSTH